MLLLLSLNYIVHLLISFGIRVELIVYLFHLLILVERSPHLAPLISFSCIFSAMWSFLILSWIWALLPLAFMVGLDRRHGSTLGDAWLQRLLTTYSHADSVILRKR